LPHNVLNTARQALNADVILYGDYTAKDDGALGDRWRLDVCLDNTRDHKSPGSMTAVGAKCDIAQLVFDDSEVRPAVERAACGGSCCGSNCAACRSISEIGDATADPVKSSFL
jgi:hypothetical protein